MRGRSRTTFTTLPPIVAGLSRCRTSGRRRSLLGLVLLASSTSCIYGAPQTIALSEGVLTATEELEVSMGGFTSGMFPYRFGEFTVSDKGGGNATERERSSGLLDRHTTTETDIPFQFIMMGSGPEAAHVDAALSTRTEWEEGFTIGDDGGYDPEELVEGAHTTSATIVFERDSAAAWELRTVERMGTAVPTGYAFEGTVTSGTRRVTLVQVTSLGRVAGQPEPDIFGELGSGYVLEEDERPIAAVQYRGGGLGIFNDVKVWLPTAATARERLEWAAILTTVMASEHFKLGVGG